MKIQTRDVEEIAVMKNNRLKRWANIQSGFYQGKVYLVGSCTHSETPRDVDVVCIISDKDFCDKYIGWTETPKEEVISWGHGYKSGMYTEAHWLWCNDVVHKGKQGARYTSIGMLDYKVFPESYDIENFHDKPKIRIDENPFL